MFAGRQVGAHVALVLPVIPEVEPSLDGDLVHCVLSDRADAVALEQRVANDVGHGSEGASDLLLLKSHVLVDIKALSSPEGRVIRRLFSLGVLHLGLFVAVSAGVDLDESSEQNSVGGVSWVGASV